MKKYKVTVICEDTKINDFIPYNNIAEIIEKIKFLLCCRTFKYKEIRLNFKEKTPYVFIELKGDK